MAATHSSVRQARQVLADRLRELRVDAGLTGLAHARACGWNPAKTSRIENNKTAPSAADLRVWCRACDADDQADDLIASLRAVEGMYVEWRRVLRDGLYQAQQARAPVYERTKRFRAYSPSLVPGMIQTTDYIRRTLEAIQRWRDLPDDVDKAVDTRLERQQLLADSDRVFAFLIEESVLYADTAPPAIMAEQLRYLIDKARQPNVSLGIIPARLSRHIRPVEGFWIFDNAQVNVELVSGQLTVTSPGEIATYAKAFTQLAELAVYGAEARSFITAAVTSAS